MNVVEINEKTLCTGKLFDRIPVASFTVPREYVMRISKLCDILNYIFV